MWACESTTGGSISSPCIASGTGLRPRHGVFVRVEHPAILLGKIEPRWREDIHQLVAIGAGRGRSVNGRRRNHCDRWRRAMLVIVIAPVLLIGHPGPADVMRERAFYRQRA